MYCLLKCLIFVVLETDIDATESSNNSRSTETSRRAKEKSGDKVNGLPSDDTEGSKDGIKLEKEDKKDELKGNEDNQVRLFLISSTNQGYN